MLQGRILFKQGLRGDLKAYLFDMSNGVIDARLL